MKRERSDSLNRFGVYSPARTRSKTKPHVRPSSHDVAMGGGVSLSNCIVSGCHEQRVVADAQGGMHGNNMSLYCLKHSRAAAEAAAVAAASQPQQSAAVGSDGSGSGKENLRKDDGARASGGSTGSAASTPMFTFSMPAPVPRRGTGEASASATPSSQTGITLPQSQQQQPQQPQQQQARGSRVFDFSAPVVDINLPGMASLPLSRQSSGQMSPGVREISRLLLEMSRAPVPPPSASPLATSPESSPTFSATNSHDALTSATALFTLAASSTSSDTSPAANFPPLSISPEPPTVSPPDHLMRDVGNDASDTMHERMSQLEISSTKKRPAGLWTKQEDDKLSQLVHLHGSNWKVVASKMPGRSQEDCKDRWHRSLMNKEKPIEPRDPVFSPTTVQGVTGLRMLARGGLPFSPLPGPASASTTVTMHSLESQHPRARSQTSASLAAFSRGAQQTFAVPALSGPLSAVLSGDRSGATPARTVPSGYVTMARTVPGPYMQPVIATAADLPPGVVPIPAMLPHANGGLAVAPALEVGKGLGGTNVAAGAFSRSFAAGTPNKASRMDTEASSAASGTSSLAVAIPAGLTVPTTLASFLSPTAGGPPRSVSPSAYAAGLSPTPLSTVTPATAVVAQSVTPATAMDVGHVQVAMALTSPASADGGFDSARKGVKVPELPDGWEMIERSSARCKYKTYISPDGRRKFRSLASVKRYLEAHPQERGGQSTGAHTGSTQSPAPLHAHAAAVPAVMASVPATTVEAKWKVEPVPAQALGSNANAQLQLNEFRRSLQNLEPQHAARPLAQVKLSAPLTAHQKTSLFTHVSCLSHNPAKGNLESSARLYGVLRALATDRHFEQVDWVSPTDAAPMASIYRAHDRRFVDALLSLCDMVDTGIFRFLSLDPPYNDTVVGRGTRDAILSAAGAVTSAVDSVIAGKTRNAFCAVRPPGSHAERAASIGFCFLNNVAIGAMHAKYVHNLQRIAVVDFDVHHGNGIQHILQQDSSFYYISVHRPDVFPFSGGPQERGAHHNVVNITAATRKDWLASMSQVESLLEEWAPDLIIISAGFDGHSSDLADHSLQLKEEDFELMTAAILNSADTCCEGRVVSVLEGGYNPDTLSQCVCAHVKVLVERAASS